MAEALAAAEASKITFGGILGKFFTFSILGGMAVGAVVSGYQSSQITNMKSKIKDLNDLNKSLSDQLTNANTQIIDMTIKTKEDYEQTMKKYMNLVHDMTQTSLEFADSFKRIQLNGVIVVIVVFFLLLLNQFDLLDTIYSIILYPFVYIYNSIVNIFKKE